MPRSLSHLTVLRIIGTGLPIPTLEAQVELATGDAVILTADGRGVSGPLYDYNILECLVPLVQFQRSFLREEIELPWK